MVAITDEEKLVNIYLIKKNKIMLQLSKSDNFKYMNKILYLHYFSENSSIIELYLFNQYRRNRATDQRYLFCGLLFFSTTILLDYASNKIYSISLKNGDCYTVHT